MPQINSLVYANKKLFTILFVLLENTMQIEQLRIRNFKVFQDVTIKDIPKMAVFVGANGSGKSTLFDVFGFLAESLRSNVRTAFNNRGGFNEVVSRDSSGSIDFEIKFRNKPIEGVQQPLITYSLKVKLDNVSNHPVVALERLEYRRGKYGRPWRFLDFMNGKGSAIINEEYYGQENVTAEREEQVLDSPDTLAIKGLGQFKRFQAISDFRKLLENWFIADFQIPDAKRSQDISYAEHLSPTGHNLANVSRFMFEHHKSAFEDILDKMEKRVPGVSKVEATQTQDGRIVLRFKDSSFKDPFISRFVSDGTLKMFAFLILLNEPNSRPLLCVEEPENYLYPDLLLQLAEEFREYAERSGQVFISTHSPDFVNALDISELFWLTKSNGYTKVHRASDHNDIVSLFEMGDKLGSLWTQDYFSGVDPELS